MFRIDFIIPCLALALIACGSDADRPAEKGEPNDATAPTDTVAPSLIGSVPANGASGVSADATVTLTFSEPMDPGTFVEALSTESLGAVFLDWNEDHTELTITPGAPLEYAEDAISYRVSLDSAARDQAGNPLDAEHDIVFTTYRSLTAQLGPVHDLTRVVTPSEMLYASDDPLVVGDDEADGGMRTTMTFDLAPLPDDAVVTWASIVTTQLVGDASGSPYTDLGELVLDHVAFAHLDDGNAINAAFNASQVAFDSYAGFCSAADQIDVDFDVTDAVMDDLAEGSDRTQYLLHFADYTDLTQDTDRAVFDRDALMLEVDYLVP